MKKLVFLILLLASTSLSAALPPLWQNVAELKAILNDHDLGNHLDAGDVIESIHKTDNGWQINTNHGHLYIHIQYEKNNIPGPAQFNIQYQKAK